VCEVIQRGNRCEDVRAKFAYPFLGLRAAQGDELEETNFDSLSMVFGLHSLIDVRAKVANPEL
jgi:hypothetical protein